MTDFDLPDHVFRRSNVIEKSRLQTNQEELQAICCNASCLDVFGRYTECKKELEQSKEELEILKCDLITHKQLANERLRILTNRNKELTTEVDILMSKLRQPTKRHHYNEALTHLNWCNYRQDSHAHSGEPSWRRKDRPASNDSLSSSLSYQVEQGTQSEHKTTGFCVQQGDADASLSQIDACAYHPSNQSICACAVRTMSLQQNLAYCKTQKETNRATELEITLRAQKIALENQFSRSRNLSKEIGKIFSLLPKDMDEDAVLHNTDWVAGVGKQEEGELLRHALLSLENSLKSVTDSLQQTDNLALNSPTKQARSSGDPLSVVLRQHQPRPCRRFNSLITKYPSATERGQQARRSWTPISIRQITLASQRKIDCLNATHSSGSRSMHDLSTKYAVDDERSNTDGPVAQCGRNQLQYQTPKVTYTMGSAAQLVGEGGRTSTDKTSNRVVAATEDSLSLLSQLYFKLNEVSELLTKQQLVNDIDNAFNVAT